MPSSAETGALPAEVLEEIETYFLGCIDDLSSRIDMADYEPDILENGLKVVFCGLNPGIRAFLLLAESEGIPFLVDL